jgi:hypothetical protein
MDVQDHVDDYARELRGNWRKFDSFGWHERPEDADEYAIVYTHNRDSGILDRCNAEVIARTLQPFADAGDDVLPEHHGHWACGWIDGYAIRVYRDGQITPAFQAYAELRLRLEDYPILDESRLSDMEYTEVYEYWQRASLRERISECASADESIYAARRTDDIPDRVYDRIVGSLHQG